MFQSALLQFNLMTLMKQKYPIHLWKRHDWFISWSWSYKNKHLCTENI